jgi:hypothetical protein
MSHIVPVQFSEEKNWRVADILCETRRLVPTPTERARKRRMLIPGAEYRLAGEKDRVLLLRSMIVEEFCD